MTDKKIRIAFYHPYFADGGAERSIIRLSAEFARMGHEIDIVTFRSLPNLIESARQHATVTNLPASRARYAIRPLARYLAKNQPDIIISNQRFANVTAAIAHFLVRSSAQLVFCERVDPRFEPREILDRLGLAGRAIQRWAYRRARSVIANSGGTKEGLTATMGISEDLVRVIYNPALAPEVPIKAREPVDHPWFGDDEPPVIVSVGRLSEQKDFATMIRAFSVLNKKTSARLFIIGEGPDKEDLVALADELEISSEIQFHNFTDNPYKYMARASVFALSSRWEGAPNVLIEALTLGVPVVSTDCRSGPNEILLDGEGGLLVPIAEPESMATSIQHLLDNQNLRDRLVRNGQAELGRFDPTASAVSYLNAAGY
ncbi:glycosyltransferase [Candidatus Lucifugimonas marina]|uniref:glycosyltransferase n=1 Tax=Candidatus Lucifugimonas marina TaxID=3038979 RepID=UPI00319E14B9